MSVCNCKSVVECAEKIKKTVSTQRPFLDDRLVGKHYWTIQRNGDYNYIYLYIIQKIGKETFDWSEIMESSSLRIYTVPADFLDNSHVFIRSHSWRENCKLFALAKSRGGLRPWERRQLGTPIGERGD